MMWFTSSNARAIQAKVEQREKGLALASAYVASDDLYLGLTGDWRLDDHGTRIHPHLFLSAGNRCRDRKGTMDGIASRPSVHYPGGFECEIDQQRDRG